MEHNETIKPKVNDTDQMAGGRFSISAFMDAYAVVSPWIYKGIPGTLFAIGVLANAILIAYLIKSGKIRLPIFVLITCLSVCDMGQCVSTLLYISLIWAGMVVHNDGFCRVTLYSAHIFYSLSVCHLILFAGLRYWQLVHPLKARVHITPTLVLKCSGVIWLINIAINIPLLLTFIPFKLIYRKTVVYFCTFAGDQITKDLCLDFATYVIPFIIITTIHALKQYEVTKSSVVEKTQNTEIRRHGTEQRALVIVLALFFLIGIPSVMHDFVHWLFAVPYHAYHNMLHLLCNYVMFFNSVLNPFIYTFTSKHIRTDLIKQFFTCVK